MMVQQYTLDGLHAALERATEQASGPLRRPYRFVRVMVFDRLSGLLEILSGDDVFFPMPGNVRYADLPGELLEIEGIQADTELLNSCYWIREELQREEEEA